MICNSKNIIQILQHAMSFETTRISFRLIFTNSKSLCMRTMNSQSENLFEEKIKRKL